MHKNNSAIATLFGPLGLMAVLSACSSQHLLVKKADFAAAELCLQTQQELVANRETQREQMTETLAMLQEVLAQQRERDQWLQELAQREQSAREAYDEACAAAVPANLGAGDDRLDKQLVGASEPALLADLGIVLPAQINTSVAPSFLDAREIELFERNSEEWVRFSLVDPKTGDLRKLERKRKQNLARGIQRETERRPVVEMRLTIGQITQMAEFVLADRSEREFPLLVGRNVLRDLMLVDVSRSGVTEPKPPERSNGLELN